MVNLEVGRSFGPLLLLGVFATLVQTAHGAAAICPGPDPCVLEQSTGCSEFLETFDVSGTCCSLSQNSATGNCIVTISNGYCEIYSTVEGPNGCPPGCECNEETNEMSCVIPGTQWTSESDQPCPESEWAPPDADSSAVDTPLPPDAESSVIETPLPPDADSSVVDTSLPLDADSSAVDTPLRPDADSSAVDTLNTDSAPAESDEAFSMKASKLRKKKKSKQGRA